MKKCIAAFLLLISVFCASARCEERGDTLTYAPFPFLPDVEYYCRLIEARWAEAESDIRLVRADWNCYTDGAPEGIDVIMYDAVMRDALIAAGWIQPIPRDALRDPEDIFPYALEGFTVEGELYGIPAFLCGNFLIYDRDCQALAEAEHITDLADESQLLVINSEDAMTRAQYAIEAAADIRGEGNPSDSTGTEDIMALIDRLAIDAHKHDGYFQLAMAYDAGIGKGYISFSESMCRLKDRIDQTAIKAISFSEQENTPRVYADAAAIASGTDGWRYEKSLELISIMTEADLLTALSVLEGQPQYLLLPRKSPYRPLADQFPIYIQLEALADNPQNHVILTR